MDKLEITENANTSLENKDILIVEDEYILATDIAEKASKAGFKNYTIVTSIEEATSYISKQMPDLVLLDISLGDGDGTALAESVLNPKQIPFIYITSYDEGDYFERAKKTQPYGFLSKPTTEKALKNAIELAVYKAENEDIKRVLEEKEIILKISQGVSKLRSIPEFLSFVVKELKPIFDFHDVGIFLVSEDGKNHIDLASLDLEISDSEWNQLIQQSGLKKIKHKDSAIESVMRRVEEEGKPILHDFKDIVAEFPDYPQFQAADILSFGYRDCLATNLKIGNRTFGMFCLNKLKKNAFTNSQISLFASITAPLSVAVDNIIANENLMKEEQFKSTLLKISNAVATITNKKELFKVIFKAIKPVFPYDELGLFVVSEDGKKHYEILDAETIHDFASQKLIEENIGADFMYEHTNSSADWVMRHGPVIVSMQELSEVSYHPQLNYMIESGLKQLIGGPLTKGNKNFGLLCFTSRTENFYTEDHLALFEKIAEQLSVALDNVLVNEQITKEKEFKETLLTISDCMSSIFEPERLFSEIFENIKPLFNFYDVGIYVLSEDGKKMTNWSVENIDTTKSKGDALLLKHNMSQFDYNTSVVEIINKQITGENAPIIKKYGNRYIEEANRTYGNTIFQNVIENTGYKEFIATQLNCYGKTLGVMYFNSLKENHFNESHFKLFQAVAEHIAMAISNIINHQEILRRESKKAFQLELGKQMSRAQDFESLLSVLFSDLNKCIPFSALSLTIWRNDTLIQSQVLQSNKDGVKDISKDFNQKFEKVFRKFKEEQFETSLTPKIFTKNIIEKNKNKSTLLKVLVDFTELNSILHFHRKLNNETDIILQFIDNEKVFTIEDVREMEEYMSLIELSISNHLAFLDIEELNFKIKQEKEYLEAEIGTNYNFGELIGSSSKMKEIYRQISLAAPTDATVLITGETGTGKELVARAIHNISKRKNNSMIKINCAALPANLIESELFGHEKGSFTGATQRRIGKFELADKGTIFLDEIGEMPLEIQVKLLRVLQEKEFERVGGNLTIKTDVRVIAATNRNLMKEVSNKNFREDLYYRLDVFPIVIPPLRERKEDIPELALHFLQKKGHRLGKRITSISDQALRELMGYDFPGNVRELEHAIEQALITSKGNYLKLNLEIRRKKRAIANDTVANGPVSLKTYEQGEIDLIMTTLKFTGGKVRGTGGAAEILDVHPNTLESKMRRMGIKRKHVLEIIENDEL